MGWAAAEEDGITLMMSMSHLSGSAIARAEEVGASEGLPS